MKKIVALIMVAVLLSMTLVACDKNSTEDTNSTTAGECSDVEPVESSTVDSSAVDSSAVESGAVESTVPVVQ